MINYSRFDAPRLLNHGCFSGGHGFAGFLFTAVVALCGGVTVWSITVNTLGITRTAVTGRLRDL